MGAVTEVQAGAAGELVQFDVRKLSRMAAPKWRARDGEGEGVPVDQVRELLDDLITRLNWPNTSQEGHDLRFMLLLVRKVMRQQEANRRAAEIALRRIREVVTEIPDPELAEEFEVLQRSVEPIDHDRVWMDR